MTGATVRPSLLDAYCEEKLTRSVVQIKRLSRLLRNFWISVTYCNTNGLAPDGLLDILQELQALQQPGNLLGETSHMRQLAILFESAQRAVYLPLSQPQRDDLRSSISVDCFDLMETPQEQIDHLVLFMENFLALVRRCDALGFEPVGLRQLLGVLEKLRYPDGLLGPKSEIIQLEQLFERGQHVVYDHLNADQRAELLTRIER